MYLVYKMNSLNIYSYSNNNEKIEYFVAAEIVLLFGYKYTMIVIQLILVVEWLGNYSYWIYVYCLNIYYKILDTLIKLTRFTIYI